MYSAMEELLVLNNETLAASPRAEADCGDYRVNRKWPSGPTHRLNHPSITERATSLGT